VIAALCAEGDSMLRNAWHVERGYENMVAKLASVGARIESVDVNPETGGPHHLYE
jgi:UDP-N-acetylglucosamine 1-carboxyvinyltransferase